ncbi:MAG: type II toxin-antitoxin system HicB family antitoxin [Chloroflexi bacterium]|nr:type II toxin-antitoxin system HicB family antitoxin [Chloroflexota bacterium]
MMARIPLILEPQPEGGYTVTSPLLPELITEGDTIPECLVNVEDAFAAVVEIYEDRGRPLPDGIYADDPNGPVSVEALVSIR